MPPGSLPIADLQPKKNRPNDPGRRSRFGEISASTYERFQALFGRSENSRHDVQPPSDGFHAPSDLGHRKGFPYRDFRIASTQNAASAFHGAHDFSIGGNPHFLTIGHINQYTGTHGLEVMKEFVSFNALYDSSVQDPQRICHPGTRESILKQICDWVDNVSDQRLLWLHGPAGVGKSAIAQTVARLYSRNKVAVATFFFFRSDTSRNDGNRLFPTITWQLAKSIPGARDCISDALDDDSDIPRKSIEDQFEYLITKPLQSIAEAAFQGYKSMPVVIIDGMDECADEKLQERLINILGKSAADSRIPLRFLVSSRPEALIKDAFHGFLPNILQIDLATTDEAYRDIEKYFKTEFGRIASKQGIEAATWPGERVLQDLTSRSSGQFVYASTVIKFIGYEYNSAPSQLDIVLGLEPNDGKAPFAELDMLYLEILRRQPEQDFLKDFLALLLAQCDYRDYGLLLKINEKVVLRKLRGMHSVVKIDHEFDAHHRSFLDFLYDSSRSRQYHLSKRSAARRYLDLIVDALVRHATKVLKQPDSPEHGYFTPEFGNAAREYPRWIDLPVEDWEESLLPIFRLKDELLTSPELCSFWERGLCNEGSKLYIIDDLILHLAFYRGIIRDAGGPSWQEYDINNFVKEDPVILEEPHRRLSSLLLILRNKGASDLRMAMNNLCALLPFGPVEIASKIQTLSDAQNLIDLACHVIHNHDLLTQHVSETARQVAVLAMEIYARAPTLPQFFLDRAAIDVGDVIGYFRYNGKYQGKPVVVKRYAHYGVNSLCQTALIFRTSCHKNIPLALGIYEYPIGADFTLVFRYTSKYSLRHWREELAPSLVEIRQKLCEVAKAVQYMHSLGFVLDEYLSGRDIDIDSNFNIQMPLRWLSLQYCCRIQQHGKPSNISGGLLELPACDRDVFMFASLLCEIFFDVDMPHYSNGGITAVRNLLDETMIDDGVWELIQKCRSDDPKSRPAMAQVVKAMETWAST